MLYRYSVYLIYWYKNYKYSLHIRVEESSRISRLREEVEDQEEYQEEDGSGNGIPFGVVTDRTRERDDEGSPSESCMKIWIMLLRISSWRYFLY